MVISIGAEPSSDSWGFVGVVQVGGFEAYRTIEAFPTPHEAKEATQGIVGLVLGELSRAPSGARCATAPGACRPAMTWRSACSSQPVGGRPDRTERGRHRVETVHQPVGGLDHGGDDVIGQVA